MEDGTMQDVALISNNEFAGKSDFRVHFWGDVWLVASLADWQILVDSDTGATITMGEVRRLNALSVSSPTGKELRRPLHPRGVVVDNRARPFTD